MSQRLRRLLAPCCLFATLAAASSASAFVRGRTNAPASQPLRWEVNPVPYVLDAAGSADAPAAAVHAAIRRGFATWEAAPCAYLSFRDDGVKTAQRVEYRAGGANVNTVTWLESGWTRDRNAIAYTTITAVQATGQLVDADIGLNGVDFTFSAEDTPVAGKVDVQNIITHEVGHFLGLDHTLAPGATMRADVGVGDLSARDLEQDDLDGVCAIYPPGSEPKPPPSEGCAVATGPSRAAPAFWLGLLLLAFAFARASLSRFFERRAAPKV